MVMQHPISGAIIFGRGFLKECPATSSDIKLLLLLLLLKIKVPCKAFGGGVTLATDEVVQRVTNSEPNRYLGNLEHPYALSIYEFLETYQALRRLVIYVRSMDLLSASI